MTQTRKNVSFKADLESYKAYTEKRPEFLYRANR